jgi:hypothetical protein
MDPTGSLRVRKFKELRMRSPLGNLFRIAAFTLATIVLSATAAFAQSATPDEAMSPNGGVALGLTLTPAQKSAIYNAVFQQRAKPSAVMISTAVGAPVPQAAELSDLPAAATGDNPQAADLKYATVDKDVVVVDPVRMRVVDVIHDGIAP